MSVESRSDTEYEMRRNKTEKIETKEIGSDIELKGKKEFGFYYNNSYCWLTLYEICQPGLTSGH